MHFIPHTATATFFKIVPKSFVQFFSYPAVTWVFIVVDFFKASSNSYSDSSSSPMLFAYDEEPILDLNTLLVCHSCFGAF